MNDPKVKVAMEKTITQQVCFTATVPIHDNETGEILCTELAVTAEETNGDWTYGISTEGDFDTMNPEEARALLTLLGSALAWSPEERK